MDDFCKRLDSTASEDVRSVDALLPMVYEELRRMADARMAGQSESHTLQPTALVHEAWLRITGNSECTWNDRAHFMATAATAMRTILIDHARKKTRKKRGGGEWKRVDIDQVELTAPDAEEVILAVDEALQRLEQVNPKWARVVVMKFFGGLSNREVAETMDIGTTSVDRYWAGAKAWLMNEFRGERPRDPE